MADAEVVPFSSFFETVAIPDVLGNAGGLGVAVVGVAFLFSLRTSDVAVAGLGFVSVDQEFANISTFEKKKAELSNATP